MHSFNANVYWIKPQIVNNLFGLVTIFISPYNKAEIRVNRLYLKFKNIFCT